MARREGEQVREGEVVPIHCPRGLSDSNALMRLKFAQAYVQTNGNGVEAARLAGYSGDLNTLKVCASRLLNREDIKSYIAEMLKTVLSAEEASAILSDIARGSLGHFLARDEYGRFIQEGTGYQLDLNSPEAQSHLHLIKKLKPTRYGTEIELHSKTEALGIFARCLQIQTSDLVRKLQLEAVLEALPEEVREPVKSLIASAEARRISDDLELYPGEDRT